MDGNAHEFVFTVADFLKNWLKCVVHLPATWLHSVNTKAVSG